MSLCENLIANLGPAVREFAEDIDAIVVNTGSSSHIGMCADSYALYKKDKKLFRTKAGIRFMDVVVGYGGSVLRDGIVSSGDTFLINGVSLTKELPTKIDKQSLVRLLNNYYYSEKLWLRG